LTVDFTEGVKWYLAFVFSTTAHEAAHAWTALKLGDDTAHRSGQVTLDPTPHIRREPIGMVAVPIISYLLGGWALHNPRRAAAMALAGPLANLTIVLLAAAAIHLGIALDYFDAPYEISFSHVVDGTTALSQVIASGLSILFSLNLLLCTFNLLPLPPLDGSGILMFFVSESAAERFLHFMHHPTLRFIGLLVAWNIFGTLFRPIQHFAVHLLYPGIY
jgi:Zn-dependent protease